MIPFSDIVSGGQFRADLQNTSRVLQAEWVTLVNEAIDSTWSQVASARPDFQVKFQDFIVASGGSASIAVPVDFFGEVDLVFAPDTTQEYSLGPFAWQNRRSPGGWLPFVGGAAVGGSRARLQGTTIYIEPSIRAGGTYRLWYCQRAKTCKFTVRLATTGNLSATGSGSGASKLLTESGNGALVVDGVSAVAGDRVLVKNQVTSLDNGIYTVLVVGSAGTPYVLGRASDYNSGATVYAGNVITATEGTVNANGFFELSSFGTNGLGTVDTDQMFFGTAAIDGVLEICGAAELLKVKTAIPAVMRDEGPPRDWQARQAQLEGELAIYWKQTRTANVPQKMVDTDMMGPRAFPWGSGW